MNQVFWRIAGRMACSMTMNQTDIFEHLQNISATFALDEELVLLAFSLLHRYIRKMRSQLVLNNDAEYMYVFFVCVSLAQKALLDEGDAAALNLALSLGLGCAKLKANQIKIFQCIGFNIFVSFEDMIELSDILSKEDWQKLSFASYMMHEIDSQSITVDQYFGINASPFTEQEFIIHHLNRELYQPQDQINCSTAQQLLTAQQEINYTPHSASIKQFIIAQQGFAEQQYALAYI
ncbi:MAG: hypothetical protein EZS28_028995 [Streblomastix strix]|uniref:Uncharacterized protein n=1 Tax=Streblomastix strix TaxID=222440 RepID=A0A5J4UYM9_9EUKA|nr:MAG: hypothetical protein EZS28_028995 [Streblomastix strix]